MEWTGRLQTVTMFLESSERDDQITASCLTISEVLAGVRIQPDTKTEASLRTKLDEMRVELLPFDSKAIDIFAELRSVHRVKTPDAINLACAGAAEVDVDTVCLTVEVGGIASPVSEAWRSGTGFFSIGSPNSESTSLC